MFTQFIKYTIYFFGIVFLIGVVTGLTTPSKNVSATPTEEPKKELNPWEQVKIGNIIYYKGGFDTILMSDFTLTNNTEKTVKDIEIVCEAYAPSGTRIDSNTRVVYQQIPAGKTITLKKFNMGFIHNQTEKVSCLPKSFS